MIFLRRRRFKRRLDLLDEVQSLTNIRNVFQLLMNCSFLSYVSTLQSLKERFRRAFTILGAFFIPIFYLPSFENFYITNRCDVVRRNRDRPGK